MSNVKKISDLRVGTKLTEDIYSPSGQLILSKGTVLNWQHLKDLYQQGLQEVFIGSAAESPVLDAVSAPGPRSVVGTLSDAVNRYQQMYEGAKDSQSPDAEIVEQCINLLYKEVLDCYNLVAFFRAFKGKADFIAEHSVAVSAIAMQIGLILEYDERSIKELGAAALLHDLGKSLLDPELTARSYTLSQGEKDEIARHPLFGHNLVSTVYGTNSRIAMGILQHHEKMDGSGYPLGRSGNDIPEFARIIAIADMFDNLLSGGQSAQRLSDYSAAEELSKCTFGQIDPLICRQFLEYLSNFYVGNIVRLNTGEIGEVLRIEPTEPTRPLVRVGEKYIDLRSNRSVIIDEVVGY